MHFSCFAGPFQFGIWLSVLEIPVPFSPRSFNVSRYSIPPSSTNILTEGCSLMFNLSHVVLQQIVILTFCLRMKGFHEAGGFVIECNNVTCYAQRRINHLGHFCMKALAQVPSPYECETSSMNAPLSTECMSCNQQYWRVFHANVPKHTFLRHPFRGTTVPMSQSCIQHTQNFIFILRIDQSVFNVSLTLKSIYFTSLSTDSSHEVLLLQEATLLREHYFMTVNMQTRGRLQDVNIVEHK